MSYIRSLSNPEGLYIFGSKSGVEIYGPWKEDNSHFHLVPYEVWDGFCSEFVKEYDDELEYMGMSITYEKRKDGSDFKYYLKYEDWELEMWAVTWDYIISRYHDEYLLWRNKPINRFLRFINRKFFNYTKNWGL